MNSDQPIPKNVICQTWCPNLGLVKFQAESSEGYELKPVEVAQLHNDIKQYVARVVNTRRMTEITTAARMRVTLECHAENDVNKLNSEEVEALALPAVIADGAARSIYSDNPKLVLAQSDNWEEGYLKPLPWQTQALETLLRLPILEITEIWLPGLLSLPELHIWQQHFKEKHPKITLKEIDHINEMRSSGRQSQNTYLDQTDKRRFASVWFPTLTGAGHHSQDTLIELRITVRPSVVTVAEEKLDLVIQHGISPDKALEISKALNAWRKSDRHGKGEWDTQITFTKPFQDTSYQLALALADRMVRGREFSPPGRLIATGEVNHQGLVGEVAGIVRKCTLISNEAKKGDRILLPKSWQSSQENALQEMLKKLNEVGATCAFLEKITSN